MYRIYLDWNVISNLKKSPNEHYEALHKLLSIHRSRLWIPYSVAHLRDLGRGYDKNNPDKIRFTYRDLNYLALLTTGTCLETYHGQDKPRKGWHNPVAYFEYLQEQQDNELLNPENIFTSLTESDSPVVSAAGNLLVEMFEQMPLPFPENSSALIEKLFPNWQQLQSYSGFMQDFFQVISRVQNDFTYSQELREEINKIPSLNPSAVSSAGPSQAFARIDQLLAPALGGKSFFQIISDSKIGANNQPKSEWNKFFESYYYLELLGYKREKLSSKNHFPNIMDDATHAYLAGHCDFFIAEDKSLRAKAAAVYAQDNVYTKICTVEEAVKELTDRLSILYTAENILTILNNTVVEAIESNRLLPWLHDESTEVKCYYLGWQFLDTFNAMEFENNQDTGLQIKFFEIKINYADSIMTEEVRDLVNTLVNCLGVDSNKKALLHRSEWDSLSSATWVGRCWDYDHFKLLLQLDPEQGLIFEYQTIIPRKQSSSVSSKSAIPSWRARFITRLFGISRLFTIRSR